MKCTLKLYVTGHSPSSVRALHNLKRILNSDLKGEHEVVVIDVLEHPQIAEDERILATPTLVKESPPPVRRVIGDLSDMAKVALALELAAAQ